MCVVLTEFAGCAALFAFTDDGDRRTDVTVAPFGVSFLPSLSLPSSHLSSVLSRRRRRSLPPPTNTDFRLWHSKERGGEKLVLGRLPLARIAN